MATAKARAGTVQRGARLTPAPRPALLGAAVALRHTALPLPARRRSHTTAAASNAGDWEFLRRSASNAREKWEEFVKQQGLDERLKTGVKAAKTAAQQAAEEAQKRVKQVDAEYDVSGKAAEAARTAAEQARKVNEQAEDLESRFQIRRRFRNFFSDVKRRVPKVMKAVGDFFDTPLGAVTFFFLFMLSVFTGAFWVIVRWFFSLVWIFILLGPLIINYLNAKAVREQQQRYREYMEEQQRRQQDPLYGTPFEGVFGGGRRSSSAPRKYASEDVIDVSIDHTDD